MMSLRRRLQRILQLPLRIKTFLASRRLTNELSEGKVVRGRAASAQAAQYGSFSTRKRGRAYDTSGAWATLGSILRGTHTSSRPCQLMLSSSCIFDVQRGRRWGVLLIIEWGMAPGINPSVQRPTHHRYSLLLIRHCTQLINPGRLL